MPGPAGSDLKPVFRAASARRTLQSWKEIAGYLRVNLRTASRWHEHEGLPIHRLGSGPKARVVAYTDELDAWIAGDQRDASISAVPENAGPASAWSFAGRKAMMIIALLVLVPGGIYLLRGYFSARIPDHLAIEEKSIAVYDVKNRLCWRQPYPDLNTEVYDPGTNAAKMNITPAYYDASLIEDIDGDGRREVLFNYWPISSYESAGKLICFEQSGMVRWEFSFGRGRSFGDRRFSAIYQGVLVRQVHAHGKSWVLSVSHHDHWFPAHAVLLDPLTGEIHQEYWHPGWIYGCNAYDLDGDGSDEVLLAGVNNPGQGVGHIGLAVLKVAAIRQPLVPDQVSADIRAFTGGSEMGYRLFPRSDLLSAAGMNPTTDILAIQEGREILFRTSGPDGSDIVYHLDFSLQVIDFRLADGFASIHDQYQRRGLLDHTLTDAEIAELGKVIAFPTAPDGNSSEINRLWAFP